MDTLQLTNFPFSDDIVILQGSYAKPKLAQSLRNRWLHLWFRLNTTEVVAALWRHLFESGYTWSFHTWRHLCTENRSDVSLPLAPFTNNPTGPPKTEDGSVLLEFK